MTPQHRSETFTQIQQAFAPIEIHLATGAHCSVCATDAGLPGPFRRRQGVEDAAEAGLRLTQIKRIVDPHDSMIQIMVFP